MASSFAGRLGQRLLPDLLRDIAFKKLTGVLRLSCDKISKSIAFESGKPINAFSSIPSEQLDTCLIKEGRTTKGLIAAAKRGQPDPTLLGAALVEKGIVSAEVMRKTASEMSVSIALSMFEWTEAEYQFEESEQLAFPGVMQATTAELVIEGTRQAASRASFIDLVAPSELWVIRRQTAGDHFADSANLNPTEGYILSMTDSPTRLSEIATLSGLPDEQIRRAVCVLLALGMLTHLEQTDDSQSIPVERTYDEVIAGITRKLGLFKNANYYEILGVDRPSSMTAINKALHQLEAMFQSHRADYADSVDVQRQLDELFGKIKTAHQTLSDPLNRREYDRLSGMAPAPVLRSPPNVESIIERGQASASPRSGMQLPPRKPILIPEIKMRAAPGSTGGVEQGQPEGSLPPPMPPRYSGPLTRPPAVLSPEETARLQTTENKDQRALRFYRQGRVRLERRELDAAAHLFREAVRLDPSQSHYHFYLAIVLTIQARARHEHMHHEGCHVTCHLGGALVSNPKVRYEAEQHFLRAGQIDPSNAKIALKLGQLYKEVGLVKKAEIYLKQALLLDSTNKDARHELDTLHEWQEEGDADVDDLDVEVR
jgi:tetratricopeptide (TPR) repeat protein